jgi:26S proteasome non-ATPase regulatory subunit 10
LGINGFAAIHYAVLVGNVEIVNFLISIGADINIKSFDDWLPIQIAIDNNNMAMIDILIAQPNLNINICTARGLPLHMAVKSGNVSIVKKLLMRDVKFTAKDQLGQTVYDILELYPND